MAMFMAVVGVREVRMRMGHGLVAMPVRMRAGRRKLGMSVVAMVLMMQVVGMRVCVLKRLMGVAVSVVLCQVQPDAQRHQTGRRQQLPSHRFRQKKD